jgi:hypothetical protein
MHSTHEQNLKDKVLKELRRRTSPHWARTFENHPRQFFREIIGPDWDGPDWVGWRSFISTGFCQPFESWEEEITFRQCTGLEDPPTERPTQIWLPTGRRAGKSRMLAGIAVYLACCCDWSEYLDPGELGVIPVLAADRRQARTTMAYVRAFLNHPELVDLMKSEQIESILLKDNILIEVVTASFRTVRSRTVVSALCDEIAFWPTDEASANPDREIITALEPAMATVPRALLLGASSPYARRGVLWEVFDRWYGQPGGPLVWRASTRTMNPTVPQSFIDQQYEQDPISAGAEYGGEFRSDVAIFIAREALDAVIARNVFEIPPAHGVNYKAFVDPSGGSGDSYTLAIGHRDYRTGLAVIDLLRERIPPFNPEAVTAEFARTLLEYRCAHVTGDHYAGEWPKDAFKRNGITYVASEKRKSDLYVESLAAINTAKCQLLDNKKMYNQFLALERRIGRNGIEYIDHPPNAHDDVCNVASGLLVELTAKAPIRVDRRVLEMSARIYRPQYPLLDDLRYASSRGW